MSSQNSRKRPAPGATPLLPVTPAVQPSYNTATSQDQVLQWAGGIPDATNFEDLSRTVNAYMMGAPGQYIQQQPRQPQQLPLQSAQPQQLHLQPQPTAQQTQAQSTSTAIARRPPNRALIPSAPRATFDPNADLWAGFGDDTSPLNINANGGNGGGLPGENESIEVLEEKAQRVKKEAQAKRKQIPPFVQKLSSFLEEQKNTELIRWSENGDSFIVLDEDEFAKTLIPELFKHNNYASFVRQLNMYGFHKRVGLSDNSMKASERKNKSPSEYYNPYFKRGHPNLLWLINKPKSGSKAKRGKKDDGDGDSDEDGGLDEPSLLTLPHAGLQGLGEQQGRTFSSTGAGAGGAGSGSGIGAGGGTSGELAPLQKKDFQIIKDELSTLQTRQAQISKVMQRLQYDNAQLQQQARLFQNMHERHENSINAILNFLANVFRKSLEEQGGVQGVTELLASILPNGQMPQGSVVDLTDDFDQRRPSVATTSISTPPKRQQRLLPPIPAPAASSASASTAASTPTAPTAGGRGGSNRPSSVLSPAQHHVSTVLGGPSSGYHHPGLAQTGQPAMGSVTELFDSPSESSYLHHELQANPHEGMMKIINDTNANTPSSGSAIDLLEAAAGTPSNLSTDQRNRVLNLMSGQNQGQQHGGIKSSPGSGGPHSGSANPVSPANLARNVPMTGPGGVPLSPYVPMTIPSTNAGSAGGVSSIPLPTTGGSTSLSPILGNMQAVPPPSLRDISNTQSEIEALQRMQEEQNAKISDLSQLLGPLSPSGRIPGIDEDAASVAGSGGQAGTGAGMQSPGYFDLGQYLDPMAFADEFNFATGDLDVGQTAAAAAAVDGSPNGQVVAGVSAGHVAGSGLNLDGEDFNFGLDPNAGGRHGNGTAAEGDEDDNRLFGKSPSPATTEEIPRTDISTGNSPDPSSKRRRVS